MKAKLTSLIRLLYVITSIALYMAPCRADGLALQRFGINDHPERYSDYTAACDEIIASGVKWVRIAPEWGNIQPSSGDTAYSATYLAKIDSIVNQLTSHGVNIDFVLCFTAAWASSMPNDPAPTRWKPANWADWEGYVNFIATRYNGKIATWEVWNEEDTSGFWKSSAADYVTLLQKAATQIRAVNSANKVLLGGLALNVNGGESAGLGTFFDTIMGLGAGNSFDIVNYHAYGGATVFVSRYNGMQAVINKYGIGSKKIWVTETGYTTAGNTANEAVKCDQVDQTYLTHVEFGNIERFFWYLYRNTSTNNASEDNFGLTANDRTPLKAFYYYQGENGAETDFLLQKNYPNQTAAQRALYYYPATGGDGSYVVDYDGSGTSKRIPSTRYMYCRVNDNWLYNANGGLDNRVYLDVTYLDTGTANWSVQYDSTSNAYAGIGKTRTNTGAWLKTTFTLDNVKFANSENNATDFRLAAGGADLMVSDIVVRKEMNIGRIVLGSPDIYRCLGRPDSTDSTQEAYNPVATVGGQSCREILANSKYIYVRVSDGLIPANTGVKIGLWLWDAGTDNIRVEYNATSGAYKPVFIAKTNTNAWRYVTLTLADANFGNAENYSSDFRISNAYDNSVEYINEVDVQRYP